MPVIRLSDTEAMRVPYDLFGQIEAELGDKSLAAAAFRAVADPAYRQQTVEAVRSGQWPASVLQAARKIEQAMQPRPQATPAAQAPSPAGMAGAALRPEPKPAVPGFLGRMLS